MAENLEQDMARGPLAQSVNSYYPDAVWFQLPNLTWLQQKGVVEVQGGKHPSGMPDGFIWQRGKQFPVECKAHREKFEYAKWTEQQRKFWRTMIHPSKTDAYLLIWLAGDRFLVPMYVANSFITTDYTKGGRSLDYSAMNLIWGQYKIGYWFGDVLNLPFLDKD